MAIYASKQRKFYLPLMATTPQAVVELVEPEKGFGNFKSPGFNTLVSVDAKDVYRRLVKLTND